MGVNIVLLTNDAQLKGILAAELSKIPDSTLHLQVPSIFQASALLMENAPNVVILDFDQYFITRTFTLPLQQHYPLLFIAYGTPEERHLSRSGLSEVLPRPSTAEYHLFARGVLLRTSHFAANAISVFNAASAASVKTLNKVIMLAASTGGTEALSTVLSALPADVPPILIVQHMPPTFTQLFAQRMNDLCRFTVKEAESGDFLRQNLALVAPGDYHMKLVRRGNFLAVECVDGVKIQGLRPAADVLFESAVPLVGPNTIGVILTGMGADGAAGLKALHDAGAVVIGQDEASSAVYGMPRAAFLLGAVDYQLPLSRIAGKIMELI